MKPYHYPPKYYLSAGTGSKANYELVIDDLVSRVVNCYFSKFIKYIIVKYGLQCALPHLFCLFYNF